MDLTYPGIKTLTNALPSFTPAGRAETPVFDYVSQAQE